MDLDRLNHRFSRTLNKGFDARSNCIRHLKGIWHGVTQRPFT